ncbi:MAG TPA: N-6 DNA methylase, partial [Chitinophagaceae bacterium]|nr:N-6 DNA methylase [Chitinophagaceae bacterium]
FDKFIASDTHKKGTTTVDAEFLASLDEWRKELAQNIALRNQFLNEDELNFAVQQIIDRIIFLRIAEDRSIEDYGRLRSIFSSFAGQEEAPYKSLLKQFHEADSKYNSGIFDFKKDTISSKIEIDSKTLKGIINELYYPLSPYEFSVLNVEILGSAYEQFLGKQIKLTAGHRAVIEEKPEVRKAGGVYYTPQYIVDYIVENTVGKLIGSPAAGGDRGIPPLGVGGIKIVDPACGSGSFLLGAYQYLLNWHKQYYKPDFERLTAIAGSNEYNTKQRNDAIKERNKLPLTPDGNLTTAIKKQILLSNIYGVDIDVQAVEVTKLSLLLKCMEGETGSSIIAEMRFGERILPTLDNNIKSGNSLVDTDFYDGQIDYESGIEKKVKPFSWQQAFPEVFKNGGFDVVIGNPPYIPIEFFNEQERKYYRKHYEEVNRKYDTSVLFILNGFKLLKQSGLLGVISTQTWETGENYSDFRKKIFTHNGIIEIINLPYDIFKDAYIDTGIFIFSKDPQTFYKFFSYNKKANIESINGIFFETINTEKIKEPFYKLIFRNDVHEILKRFDPKNYLELGKISISTQGLSASRFSETIKSTGQFILPFINATVKRYFFKEESKYYVDIQNLRSL